jgi:hypothetical protein
VTVEQTSPVWTEADFFSPGSQRTQRSQHLVSVVPGDPGAFVRCINLAGNHCIIPDFVTRIRQFNTDFVTISIILSLTL